MTEQLKVAVVGAGAIAQVAHLPLLARMPEINLVGLCDNDLPKAQSLAGRFGIEAVFEDIEELLEYCRPDAVALCTPNHLHEVHLQTVLSHGAHALCERPFALSAEGAEDLIDRARRSGKVVMVGMNHRYRSDIQVIRGFLQGGELGRLRSVRAGWYEFRPSRAALGWRKRPNESGGGAMLDLGLSVIDLALWLSGAPKVERVTATLVWDPEAPEEVDEAGVVLLGCADGPSIFVDVSWRYLGESEKFWLEIAGARGAATLHPLKIYKEMQGTPRDVTPTGARSRENVFSASYRSEWANFVAAVRGEVEPPRLEDQLVLHRVLEATYQSARSGREVIL